MKSKLYPLVLITILFGLTNCNREKFPTACSENSYGSDSYKLVSPNLGSADAIHQISAEEFIVFGYDHDDMDYDFQLSKISESGEVEWMKFFDSDSRDISTAFIETTDKGFLLLGSTTAGLSNGTNIYIVKTDSEGIEQWHTVLAGENNESVHSCVQLIDGGFMLVGDSSVNGTTEREELILRLDEEGKEIWRQTNGYTRISTGRSIVNLSESEVLIFTVLSEGFRDPNSVVLLTKMTLEGEIVWQKDIDIVHTQSGRSKMIKCVDGSFLFGTSFASESDMFNMENQLVKINSEGEVLWKNIYETDGSENFSDVLELGDESIVILADGDPCNEGRTDIHISKVTADGMILWQKIYGGVAYEAANRIIKRQDNGFLIIGHTKGTDFNSDFDLILLSIDENGDPD